MASEKTPKAPLGRSLAELWASNFATPEWLLNPILKEAQSCMIWAAPAVGKSMLALSSALAIAGGGKLGPWEAPKPRKVMFWDGELAMADLVQRVKLLPDAIVDFDREKAGGNLVFVARNDPQNAEAEFPDIATAEGLDELLSRAKRHKVDLVIIDNLSTLAMVKDENDASEIAAIVSGLLRFKQAQIATILVHHANKGKSDFRGSSNLATTFETIMGLTPRNDALQLQEGARFNLDFTKYRDRRSALVRTQDVDLMHTEAGPVWRFEASAAELHDAIAAVLKSGKVTNIPDLVEHLPASFWPEANQRSGKRPAKTWCYDQVKTMVAAGVMTKGDVKAALRPWQEDDLGAARGDPYKQEEEAEPEPVPPPLDF